MTSRQLIAVVQIGATLLLLVIIALNPDDGCPPAVGAQWSLLTLGVSAMLISVGTGAALACDTFARTRATSEPQP